MSRKYKPKYDYEEIYDFIENNRNNPTPEFLKMEKYVNTSYQNLIQDGKEGFSEYQNSSNNVRNKKNRNSNN